MSVKTPHVLGISASPVADTKTETDLIRILDHTELDTDVLQLTDYDDGRWENNGDGLKSEAPGSPDSGRQIVMRFRRVPAFVMASYTSRQGLDALSRGFLERIACRRNEGELFRGKVGAALIATPCHPDSESFPTAATLAAEQVSSWMRREGILNAGVVLLLGNASCLRCAQQGGCALERVAVFESEQNETCSSAWSPLQEREALLNISMDIAERIRQSVLSHARRSA